LDQMALNDILSASGKIRTACHYFD
jgi:hypothetical protein